MFDYKALNKSQPSVSVDFLRVSQYFMISDGGGVMLLHGGGVMLLVHKDISHMPITELENDSESIWVKVFANKTSHFVASYRPPGSTSEEF